MADQSSNWNFWSGRLHPDDHKLLLEVRDGICDLRKDIANLTKLETVMKQQIADLVALVGPLVTAVQGLEAAVATENVTIAALQAKVDAGTALDADDQAALLDAATKITALTAEAIAKAQPVPAAAAAAIQAAAKAPA